MRLNYKSFGQGTPVIILHGLLGSLDNWQTFAKRLSSEFKVYTVDLRNHGRTVHNDVHTYQAMADDLLEFFEEHQIQKAHLIGHSMGGKAAMQFAIEHTVRVLKLIIVDISPRAYQGNHDEIFNALLELDLSHVTKRDEADFALSKRISDVAVRQFLLKNLQRNSNDGFSWKMNLKGLWDNYDNINVPIHPVSQIEIPVIVIRGGKSGYVEDKDLDSFKEIFPQTKLITIPGAGHWVHAEAPDEFYNLVRANLYN